MHIYLGSTYWFPYWLMLVSPSSLFLVHSCHKQAQVCTRRQVQSIYKFLIVPLCYDLNQTITFWTGLYKSIISNIKILLLKLIKLPLHTFRNIYTISLLYLANLLISILFAIILNIPSENLTKIASWPNN